MAVSLLSFVVLRAVSSGWTQQVAAIPGVKRVPGASCVGLTLAAHPRLRFDAAAQDARAFVDMHDELVAPSSEQRAASSEQEAFVADRTGALASSELAEELGWHTG